MLRKLLIICCVLSSGTIFAQTDKGSRSGDIKHREEVTQAKKPVEANYFASKDIDHKAPGAPLPEFIVRTIDGKLITNKDMQYNANLFLMIFNPTCGHCEEMTEMLEKNIALFSKTKLLLVATAPMQPYMKDFQDHHHIAQYPAIRVACDSTKLIDKLFSYKMLPQINIYDKDRKLIRSFYGDTPIDSLKDYIQ
jgi:thiol-disulfide isomerase/thioredoxin